MGNILRCLKGDGGDVRPPPQQQQPPLGPHGVTPATAGVAALARDVLNFEATSMVPEGLGRHVTSSSKAQAKWYRKVLEAYKDANPPPRTPAEAATLLATALSAIQRADLEGVLAFYGFPIPILPAESSEGLSTLPEGVQFVLNTLPFLQISEMIEVSQLGRGGYQKNRPIRDSFSIQADQFSALVCAPIRMILHVETDLVYQLGFLGNHFRQTIVAKCIGDGDGFTAYVSTADPRESANVPLEVHESVIQRDEARKARNYHKADALESSIKEAGYKMVPGDGEAILARKYRIRMRGIDAPELEMPHGKESKNALVKLIAGRSVKIHVYEQDQFGRHVGDIHCNGVFVQEQMLKNGFAWHYKTYDKRPEFAQWEREAKAAHRGLWASSNPEKPWEWRRDQRNAGQLRQHNVLIPVC